MRYKIKYAAVGKRRYPSAHRESKRRMVRMFAVLCGVFIGAILLRMSGISVLPGDQDITASALDGLIENISRGTPFFEAVDVFCREVISGAF